MLTSKCCEELEILHMKILGIKKQLYTHSSLPQMIYELIYEMNNFPKQQYLPYS
jgi:hypothetical protein